MLNYLTPGKGVIPYEKVKTSEDLLAQPERVGFAKTKFYSSLRNEVMGSKGYGNVRKFYKIMPIWKLTDLKNLYDMEDTILPLQNIRK